MNKLILFISSSLLALTVFATESETLKGAQKDIENFKKEMSVKLGALEEQIASLKSKATEKGSETKSKTIQELEAARDALKVKMAEFSDSSKEGWANMKKSFAESMDALNAKVQKALKE